MFLKSNKMKQNKFIQTKCMRKLYKLSTKAVRYNMQPRLKNNITKNNKKKKRLV